MKSSFGDLHVSRDRLLHAVQKQTLPHSKELIKLSS